MSEPIEPPVLDSRNSNCRSDSNSERDGTPERTPEQTPASPPVLEETVVESVVKIVGTTNSNLSDKSIPHDRTLLPSRKEPLCHSTSDGDILKESRTRVQTPENIEYVRSKSGFSDAIGNKVITASTKVHGVSSEYVRLHRALIGITIPKGEQIYIIYYIIME
jgi:hypothetical protein